VNDDPARLLGHPQPWGL